MIREIIEWPDPLLTGRRSFPATPCAALDALVADMIQTMKHARGCGLAAIQVGVPIRLFVLDVGSGAEVYLNPEWTPWKGAVPVPMDEGCLSVPAPKLGGQDRYFRSIVPRFERINVAYMDQRGMWTNAKFRGLRAQAFQHEHEHLEGKIFLDHLPEEKREWLRQKLAAEKD